MNIETIITNTSGGKSSMAQAVIIKRDYGHKYNQICLFANTGMENEETLEFLNKCDKEYGLNIIWLEAVVHGHNEGNTYRITNFKDAYRIEQYKDPLHPFHAHVKKNGIPNATYPQCSDRLKEHVIELYKKDNGLKGVKQALGMRIDEENRATRKSVRDSLDLLGVGYRLFRVSGWARSLHVTENANFGRLTPLQVKDLGSYIKKLKKYNLVFPMCDWFPMTKDDVNDFWEDQPFNLELEAHKGNCATCWKKSDKKLHLIAIEQPEKFEAFNWLEETYKHVKPNTKNGKDRVFFRGHKNCKMIIGESALMDSYMLRKLIGANTESESGCGESCNGYQL